MKALLFPILPVVAFVALGTLIRRGLARGDTRKEPRP